MNDGVKIVAKLGSALRLNSNHLVIHKNPHYFLTANIAVVLIFLACFPKHFSRLDCMHPS